MRVAFFCPTVSGTGGIESATRNLMAGFEALGDDVRLFVFGGTYDAHWLEGCPHTVIGSPHDARLLRLTKYALGAVRAFWQWSPDVVLCLDGTMIEMARLGRRLSGRSGVKIASWVHFPLQEVRLKEKLQFADLHLAISLGIAEDLKVYLPEHRERVFTIYNGVDVEAYAMVPRPKTASLLYVGRLNFDDHKRTNDLLLAVAGLRGEWRLKVVGAPAKNLEQDGVRLRALASELGLDDRVEWLGWQRDPWTAAGETTALVMPSAREAFGMVLIEAASRGIVCVSSDCKSGPAEIVVEGISGWLYPVADIPRLTARLQALVNAPLALAPQEAIREIAMRFSCKATAERARVGIQAAMA